MTKKNLTSSNLPQNAAAITTVPVEDMGKVSPMVEEKPPIEVVTHEEVEDARDSSSTPRKRMIEVKLLELSDEFRFRAEENKETVARYEELYQQYIDDYVRNQIAGIEATEPVRCPLPPLVVLHENGKYLVVSGWHRTLAARNADLKKLPCYVLTDRAEAFRKGFEENKTHGQPLTKEDRVHCIRKVIEVHSEWTNRQVADFLGFGRRTTDELIKRHKLRTPDAKVVGKDGKSYGVNRAVRATREPLSAEIKWKAVSKSPPKDDEQRCSAYRDVILAMTIDFTDKKYRDKFLKDIADIANEEKA